MIKMRIDIGYGLEYNSRSFPIESIHIIEDLLQFKPLGEVTMELTKLFPGIIYLNKNF